jgi:hypothetical protein
MWVSFVLVLAFVENDGERWKGMHDQPQSTERGAEIQPVSQHSYTIVFLYYRILHTPHTVLGC